MTFNQFIDFLYYKCLPPEWVTKDMRIYPIAPFYRYLQALTGYDYIRTYIDAEGNPQREVIGHAQSGFETIINCTNTFNYLVDPDKCPDKVFPFLFSSFGLTYNPDIENKTDAEGNPIIYYHRKLLKNLGALLQRRGTITGLRYLIRLLTGFEFVYEYERRADGRYLNINLLVTSTEDEINLAHTRAVIENFLSIFVPHYIHVVIGSSLTFEKVAINSGSLVPTSMYALEYDVRDSNE